MLITGRSWEGTRALLGARGGAAYKRPDNLSSAHYGPIRIRRHFSAAGTSVRVIVSRANTGGLPLKPGQLYQGCLTLCALQLRQPCFRFLHKRLQVGVGVLPEVDEARVV